MYVQNDQRLTDYGDKLIKLEEFFSIWGTSNTRPLQMNSLSVVTDFLKIELLLKKEKLLGICDADYSND